MYYFSIFVALSLLSIACYFFPNNMVFGQVKIIDNDTFSVDSGLDDVGTVLGASKLAKQRIGPTYDIMDVAIIPKIISTEGAIAKINVTQPEPDVGTGFLVSDSLLLTNNHVIGSPEAARGTTVIFNYQKGIDKKPLPTDTYSVNDSVFYTNPALDYTLVRLDGSPGEFWSFVPLSNYSDIALGNRTSIIQHPSGGYKAWTYGDGAIVNIDPKKGIVKYTSDTLRGSSGSPVFNLNLDLIALHHFSGDQDISGTFLNNEGIMIKNIIDDLRNKLNKDTEGKKILEELKLP